MIILATLSYFGAFLFLALAVTFTVGRVFSPWLRIFLVLLAIIILNYSRQAPDTAAIRAAIEGDRD